MADAILFGLKARPQRLGDLTFLLLSEPSCRIHHRDFRNPRYLLFSTNGVLEVLTSVIEYERLATSRPSGYFAAADFAI
jgi:hypothetical protein